MAAGPFQVRWTPEAFRMLQDVSDSRLRELIFKRAKQLEAEPENKESHS